MKTKPKRRPHRRKQKRSHDGRETIKLKSQTLELATFANALREYLGLSPLYLDGLRDRDRKTSEEEREKKRFYIHEWSANSNMTGMTSRHSGSP